MKRLSYLSLLTISFIAYGVSASQNLQTTRCTFSGHSEGVEVAGIGDRQIYTLFTGSLVHERDAIYEALQNSSSPTNFSMRLNEIIENNRAIIASEQSDVQKIVELLRQEQIDWIGVDSSPEILQANPIDVRIVTYFENRNFLNTNLNFRHRWDSNKTEQVLSLIFYPYIIALANNPDILNRVEVIPLDDYVLRRTEVQHYNDVDYYMGVLLEVSDIYASIDRSVLESFSRFLRSKTSIAELVTISNNELEELLDGLGVEEDARRYMRRIVEEINAATDLSRQRSQNAVKSILNQLGNGLVLFGAAHGPSVKQGLTTACQNNL